MDAIGLVADNNIAIHQLPKWVNVHFGWIYLSLFITPNLIHPIAAIRLIDYLYYILILA